MLVIKLLWIWRCSRIVLYFDWWKVVNSVLVLWIYDLRCLDLLWYNFFYWKWVILFLFHLRRFCLIVIQVGGHNSFRCLLLRVIRIIYCFSLLKRITLNTWVLEIKSWWIESILLGRQKELWYNLDALLQLNRTFWMIQRHKCVSVNSVIIIAVVVFILLFNTGDALLALGLNFFSCELYVFGGCLNTASFNLVELLWEEKAFLCE